MQNIASDLADKTNFESIYLRSKTLLLKGIILAKLDDKAGSIDTLELSQHVAEQALKLQDDSDCWRIMGEAGSAIMLQKGISYIIANGGKVEEYIDRAIETCREALTLYPGNSEAAELLAELRN